MSGRIDTLFARLERHLIPVPEAGCWLWDGSVDSKGYGRINCGGIPLLAHRVSWEMHRGHIPSGAHVLHKCDTTACCNPGHLFIGDNSTNTADKVAKGRQCRGARRYNAKLNDEKARGIFLAAGTMREIADRFGVGLSRVYAVKNKWAWVHATKGLRP